MIFFFILTSKHSHSHISRINEYETLSSSRENSPKSNGIKEGTIHDTTEINKESKYKKEQNKKRNSQKYRVKKMQSDQLYIQSDIRQNGLKDYTRSSPDLKNIKNIQVKTDKSSPRKKHKGN